MILPRPSALRGFSSARLLRSTPRAVTRPQWQQIARRGYAEGGHGAHGEPSSDLPWLISGIAVTIPSCYFLWPEQGHADAHGGHGDHEVHEEHDEAEESKDEPEEEAPAEEEPKEEAPAEDDKKDESKDEAPKEESKDEPKEDSPKGEGQQTPDTASKDEAGDKSGAKVVSGDSKREPDSKGAFKKRIDSPAGKELGSDSAKDAAGNDNPSSASGVSEDDDGSISKKQKGLSTTVTKHSTDIANDPEKSKKGEGSPETAKLQGTVKPSRDQV